MVAGAVVTDPSDEWVENAKGHRLLLQVDDAAGGCLCAPIGFSGAPVYLDIKESALGGIGPHGLCTGAAGSGNFHLVAPMLNLPFRFFVQCIGTPRGILREVSEALYLASPR